MRSLRFVFLITLSAHSVFSQDTLALDQAIRIALENNNILKVSNKLKEISSKDVTLGNSGFLPVVSIGATNTIANNDIRQELTDGRVIVRDNAKANNFTGNASLNWMLFDGMRRNNMYSRLKFLYVQADAQTKVDIENTIGNVTNAYFELVRQKEIEEAYISNLNLYQERLRLAEARQTSGLTSKSDVLLTRVDINTQRSILLRQQILIENASVNLNQVLNRDVKTQVKVSKNEARPVIDTNVIFSGRSNALTVTESDINIADKQLREINSDFFPKLNLIAAYNYTRNQSQAGLTLLNRSTGPSIGLGFSWNIFDGFNKNRVRNAGLLRIDIARYLHEENKLTQYAAYQKAMVQYKTAVKILTLEQESFALARESNEIAKQRYQAGSINLFEYKDTQLALEASKVRLANARFDTMATETEINRLNGQLIK